MCGRNSKSCFSADAGVNSPTFRHSDMETVSGIIV